MDVTYLPLIEADGSHDAIIAHGADVTEQVRDRREVERLLAESERARHELELANLQLQDQQLELELSNQQLQEQAAELEAQTEELQTTSIALAERREAAEAANEAKTRFLATMSHELRTPLNAIAGYAELLEIGIHGPLSDEQVEVVQRIQRSERHLLGLINDVLNFAKLEAGRVDYHVTSVPVREVIDTLEALIAPQLRAKGLRFARDECVDGRVVRADAEKLQQILVNLLSNAIKFTAAGGTVSMYCTERGDAVAIEVRDTGIGIAPDRLDDAFAPFVQIDRRLNAPYEGTGLGLAISRDLARGMGGDLTAESIQGKGSSFTLTLPKGL